MYDHSFIFSGPVKAGIDVRNGWMIGWLSNGITEN